MSDKPGISNLCRCGHEICFHKPAGQCIGDLDRPCGCQGTATVQRSGFAWCVLSPYGSVLSRHLTRRSAERFAVQCGALITQWSGDLNAPPS